MARVVTFDAGMTLVELDLDFLAQRLAQRGIVVSPAALRAAAPAAWHHYDERVDASVGAVSVHGRLWHELIGEIIAGAGAPSDTIGRAVEWLWEQQTAQNLFRAPIADMVALARRLRADGVRTAVISNSEGRLAELLAEIGIADAFEHVIDSGRLGIEKPDPRIFAHALELLGVAPGQLIDTPAVHVGDSWSADVGGALAAGWRAIWYGRRAEPRADPRVAHARDAGETAAALARW
ncbi:MAG: HAD-IA family hydrolase [Deltaproteobacteria bacterium]